MPKARAALYRNVLDGALVRVGGCGVPLARHLMPLSRYSGTVESDMVDGKKPRSRTRGRRAHEPDAADREAPALRRDPNRHKLPARKAAPAPSRPTALTERAADLRAASMKTPSYPTASCRWRARLLHAVALAPCEGQRQLPAKCPPFEPIFPPFDHDRPDDDLTARTADRAVLYKLRRFLACAVERRAFLAGANPARQLSLQPVATGAAHGGNDMG